MSGTDEEGAARAATESEGRAATERQLRGGTVLLAGRLLSKFVNFGIQVAIIRLVSKDDFGLFAYGLALAQSGELVVKLGLGRGANRFVPYHAERREYAEVIGTLALVCATIIGLGALGFALLVGFSDLGLAGLPRGEGARIVLILSLLAPIGALDTIGIQTLACFSRPRAILLRKHVLGPLLRLVAVALVALAGGGVEALALGYVAGGLLGLVICLDLARRELRARGIWPLPMAEWRVPWRPLLRFSLPLMSSDLVFIVLTGVTTAILMATHGEPGVAEMRAVVPAAALIGLVVQSFGVLYLPSAMRLHARGDAEGLGRHHWRSVAWVAVLSFPIFGLTFGVAPTLVPILLGDAYAASAAPLAVLAVGHYVSVCLAFNSDTLQVFARTRGLVAADALAIVVGLAGALVLCPSQGALGAAIAVTAARLVGAAARQIQLLRTEAMAGVPSGIRALWGVLAGAAAGVAALGWLWQPPFVVQLALLALVSLGLLRGSASLLDLDGSFPELRRVPWLARMIGA